MQSIYKFRDWRNDYHKDVLCKRQFFCSSIADFNDPFDSRVPINYMDLNASERIEVVENHVSQHFPRAVGKDRLELVEKVFQESAIADPDELRKNYRDVVLPMLEERMGILSFAGNKEHILLWSHYANSHKGFSVGIDRERLEEWVKPLLVQQDIFIAIYDVEYEPEYPSLNPLELSIEEYYALPFITKAEAWEYEDEVRLIFKDGAGRKLELDEELFTEVNLGCNIPCEDREEILSVIESEFDDLPLYQAVLAESEFALDFERIT